MGQHRPADSDLGIRLIDVSKAAVAYLKQKGIAVSWDWQDILDDAHATAFTVAKTAKMDVLSDIYSAVVDAAEQGRTLEEFSRELAPVLQRKGW